MKATSSSRLIVAILIVTALALAFWMLLLSPKREEADKLSSEAGQLQVALSEAQAKAAQAEAAREEFPGDYRQLVVLGQAVPAGEETSSLLVELNAIAATSHVRFSELQLESSGSATAAAATPEPAPSAPASPSGAQPASSTIPPTEAAASLLPLGAAVGPAGLGVMPYGLTFEGNFFQIANFIKGIDAMVDTKADVSKIGIKGRLVTLNGFSLTTETGSKEDENNAKSPKLAANFSVTTYVTPPSQGTTAGATAAAPASVTSAAGANSAATTSASATESSSETGPAQ
jgi:Tfp pilus assembly protein PilO